MGGALVAAGGIHDPQAVGMPEPLALPACHGERATPWTARVRDRHPSVLQGWTDTRPNAIARKLALASKGLAGQAAQQHSLALCPWQVSEKLPGWRRGGFFRFWVWVRRDSFRSAKPRFQSGNT